MSKSKRKRGTIHSNDDNGFAEWGGYMEAKKVKLQEQFKADAAREKRTEENTMLFSGVAIFVNGYSEPSADELKLLMMKHGGDYHHYYRAGRTTHIIATNLPDSKVKQLKNMNVVRPNWIVESIAAGKLLDYQQYLLYSRQSKTQPKLAFRQLADKPSTSKVYDNLSPLALEQVDEDKGSQEGDECKHSSIAIKHQVKTASEAGFLSEFYSNSRLHHISTMAAMLKQYVSNLREKSISKFPGVEKLMQWKQNKINSSAILEHSLSKFESVIMHIDMDCFFVSVGLRNRPELKGFPVAVTHAKSRGEQNDLSRRPGVDRITEFKLLKSRREEKIKTHYQASDICDFKPLSDRLDGINEYDSMSEIASCNYEARQNGLKNGMFLGQALKLCPNLKTIPYNFESYKEVSHCLYDTVASYSLDIEAVSCDEMFVDCTSLLNTTHTTPLQLATLLRQEIKEKTSCPCSTGFGSNRLLARLATRKAKPNGQFFLEASAVHSFMQQVHVADLPGVGRATSYKLLSMGVKSCGDLQQIPLAKLQSEFGAKSGDFLYKACRGEDKKKLLFGQIRKSVSAEVNYGIRFQKAAAAETFLEELAREVHSRLTEVGMKTKLVTLKLMVRAKDAPVESAKFLGHGLCDTVSRSSALQTAIADVDYIIREVMSLNRQLNVEATEMRGVGIHLSRLERFSSKSSVNVMDKFLRAKSEISARNNNSANQTYMVPKEESKSKKGTKCSTALAIDKFFVEKKSKPSQKRPTPPSSMLKEIDREVLDALPEDIRKEVLEEYGLTVTATIKPSTLNNSLNYSQIDEEVLEQLPSDIQQEIQDSYKSGKKEYHLKSSDKPGIVETLSEKEVRMLITEWTASEESPQSCDREMLAGYMAGLVHRRLLESVDTCVSCLHRCIEKKQKSVWQDAYHSIVSSIQAAMVTIYGIPLRVPTNFQTIS